MKTFFTLSNKAAFITASLLLASVYSCKEIEEPVFSAQQPLQLDETAGTWTPIILTTNYTTQVPVPAPTAVTSDAYKAELATIKDAQSRLTKSQKDIIEYWSAGGVLRWNQILRGLVAKYNLPPAPSANGTYPLPDAENPFGDPNFPFANPPYAARGYSYVAVAQYDALKAAWYYKYQYNRPAPYDVDNSIQALVPKTTLPAYPSEDAVVSGATAEMLKLLFPAAVEEITLRAAEQRNAALWSGKASSSDISAGLALGKAVAGIITAPGTGRFRTDGMGNAVGNAALWKQLADDAITKGEIPWISRESPPRPPMLPNFGKVKAWNMSPAQITAERPAAPPSTSSELMQEQLAEVKGFVDNQSREQLAIVYKWADGAGTYAPPGHWNDIAEEYIVNAQFSEVRAARAFALLNMAMHDAAVGCWETKYFYFNPRPSQLDPSIRTKTGLPNFPAFTSGHSTFSASAATVLGYLFPSEAQYFLDLAREASISRMYGGIHYRADCEMGYEHGKRIGGYTLNFAAADGAN
jgi:PAP2 superfamily